MPEDAADDAVIQLPQCIAADEADEQEADYTGLGYPFNRSCAVSTAGSA
jgi:hypothetical protein